MLCVIVCCTFCVIVCCVVCDSVIVCCIFCVIVCCVVRAMCCVQEVREVLFDKLGVGKLGNQ